ncbi:MAG: UbiD family decarboxylase, partial [Conexivisphaerales archaeon]|nr:UbiD family decarboxylase [Conexivisphaerales archaeon]
FFSCAGPPGDLPHPRHSFPPRRASDLKMVTVVDEDINPEDPEDVEFAIATRFQPDRDLIVLPGMRGSSLDPSSDQATLTTAKWGIDATAPMDGRDRFRRAKIA